LQAATLGTPSYYSATALAAAATTTTTTPPPLQIHTQPGAQAPYYAKKPMLRYNKKETKQP
jgi:hypothetical protein